MKTRLSLLVALIFCVPTQVLAAERCSAFVDVTVVGTDHEQLLPHRTVMIRGSKIISVTNADKHNEPFGCQLIDGKDRYLVPGLVDTHVHFFGYSRGGKDNRATELAIIHMLLANGITTAVVMEGTPGILQLRNELREGKIEGPTIYSTGPLIQAPGTGAPPGRQTFGTPVDVRAELEREKQLGYDFVKVHGGMSAETYRTLLNTAHQLSLPVVGHVPDNLGIYAALDGGQIMIAHAESYLQTYFEFHRKLPTNPAEIDAMVHTIAESTAKAHVFVQPTLSVFHQIITQVADLASLLERPEMRLLPSVSVRDWLPDENPYAKHWTVMNIPHLRAEYRVMQILVRGLRDAHVPLLVGTDDMVPTQLPGFSIRDEMEQLEEAGLTPFEVLQAATYTPAVFLGAQKKTGLVRSGFAADLILLDANPLDDVRNVFKQDGIMLHGHWMSEREVQQMLWSTAGQHSVN